MNTRTKITMALAGALAGCLAIGISGATMAQSNARDGKKLNIKKLDANADGFISQEEIQAQANQRFNNLDKNGDGQISQAEFPSVDFSRLLARADKDEDGRLSVAELKDQQRKRRSKKSSRE